MKQSECQFLNIVAVEEISGQLLSQAGIRNILFKAFCPGHPALTFCSKQVARSRSEDSGKLEDSGRAQYAKFTEGIAYFL